MEDAGRRVLLTPLVRCTPSSGEVPPWRVTWVTHEARRSSHDVRPRALVRACERLCALLRCAWSLARCIGV
jgi:hypothetical protein